MIQENRLAYLQGILNAFEDLIFVIDENGTPRLYVFRYEQISPS